jgi:glycosyltransferase involved in cell wall biosynthesis
MEKLSIIIITRNEQENIKDCLESVKWADEIILVDSASTDKTIEIAKEYTDKIFITNPKGFCEPDREFAVTKTSNDWIFYIDADERVSLPLKKEIQNLLSSSENKLDAYFVSRKVFFLGKFIKGCGWYPGRTIRLFKKGKVYFAPVIFTDGKPLGSYGYLKEHILHYSYKNLGEYFTKLNRYSSLLADKEFNSGLRINKINFVFLFVIKPIFWFIKKYFFLKGFIDGMSGFYISYFTAAGMIITYAKVWEKQRASKLTHD